MRFKINTKYNLDPSRGYLVLLSTDTELGMEKCNVNIAQALADRLSLIGYNAEYVNIFDNKVCLVRDLLSLKHKASLYEFGLLYLSNLSYCVRNVSKNKVRNQNKIVVISHYRDLMDSSIFSESIKPWLLQNDSSETENVDYIFNLTVCDDFNPLPDSGERVYNINSSQLPNAILDSIMSVFTKESE